MYEQYTCKLLQSLHWVHARPCAGAAAVRGPREKCALRLSRYTSDADSYQRMPLIERLLRPRVAGHLPRTLAAVRV